MGRSKPNHAVVSGVEIIDSGSPVVTQAMTHSATPMKPQLVGRQEAADLLGVSKSTIKRWQGTKLKAIKQANGTYKFRVDELRQVVKETIEPLKAADYDAQSAMAAYRLLERGDSPIALVTELGLDPRAARAMCDEYARLRGGFFVMGTDAADVEMACNNAVAVAETTDEHGRRYSRITSVAELIAYIHKEHDLLICPMCKRTADEVAKVEAKVQKEREKKKVEANRKAAMARGSVDADRVQREAEHAARMKAIEEDDS